MKRAQGATVFDKDGVRGVIENQAAPPAGATSAYWCIRLENGRRVIVPSEVLEERADVDYLYLPVSLTKLGTASFDTPAAPLAPSPPPVSSAPFSESRPPAQDGVVIPVIAEELLVDKREVVVGGVRLHKTVQERLATVDEPLARDEINVERVAVNRLVDAPVAIREEEDTLIIPLLEEVLLVEKRLVLREELHVTRRRTITHRPQQVTLRREEVTVERFTDAATDEERSPVTTTQPPTRAAS